MAIGLSVPLVASRGRLVLESGESQMAKLIRMSCFDNASSNPWNGDAGSPSSIFKLDTPEVRGRMPYERGLVALANQRHAEAARQVVGRGVRKRHARAPGLRRGAAWPRRAR